jgi:5-formyltetrahydrofolate cyclo-ligase
MLKSDARKELLAKRKNLTASECLKWDDLLLIQFQKLDWSNVSCVANFYPLENQNEPNSLLFTRYLKLMIPGIQMVYPVVNSLSETINFYKESEDIQFNDWGIAEPTSNEIVEPSLIDAVIVPLIGFDRQGHRIGFGKGFYDKYFENYPKHRPRIGVSYFEPLSNIEDTHEFDVPLTHCITPWNSYEF